MEEWTYKDIEGILENITIREHYKDDTLSMRQLLAHEGYAIYDTTEELYTDSETGETFPPLYSYQVTLPISANYNVYKAVLIEPDMRVVCLPKEPEVTE